MAKLSQNLGETFIVMPQKTPNQSQLNLLFPLLKDQLNPKHPLYQFAHQIDWKAIEADLGRFYVEQGRPAKPIRLMVGLLLLKQLDGLGDETVVEKWIENPYYQYFCGMDTFQWEQPVHPSDFPRFRSRIGQDGMEKLLKMSTNLHGEAAMEDQIVVDTTVQEKAITFPTDSKLQQRALEHLWQICELEGITLKQSYRRKVKNWTRAQHKGHLPRRQKAAKKARRELKTAVGRVLREVERKLSPEGLDRHGIMLERYHDLLAQTKTSKHKLYSLHAPEVACIAKGKAHPKYEFGSKVSIALCRESGIVVSVLAFRGNPYDGKTLEPTLHLYKKLHGKEPTDAIVDRGYKGRERIGKTKIHLPGPPQPGATPKEKAEKRAMFRRRAAIEPRIAHLKYHHGLKRNWLKGHKGDQLNLLLSATAYNLRLWMIRYKETLKKVFLARFQIWTQTIFYSLNSYKSCYS